MLVEVVIWIRPQLIGNQIIMVKALIKTNGLNKSTLAGFPGGAVVKNLLANAGDTGLSPGPGRSHMPRST